MNLRRFFLTTPGLFLTLLSFGQHDLRRVNIATLPEPINLVENVSIAIRWTDTAGDHVVVTTQKIHRRGIL